MSVRDVISNRRSTRRYSPEPVERNKILECLEAARLAPSACNAQPWQFIVIDEEPLRSSLAGEAFSGVFGVSRFARQAPVLLAVVSDPDWLPRAGGTLRRTDFHLIDIGIAGEHLVLRAAELGLGTCWIGWFDEAKAKKALDVPAGKRIEIMLAMGYPAPGTPAGGHERKSLEEICFFNGWANRP
jgi:nitroreductase